MRGAPHRHRIAPAGHRRCRPIPSLLLAALALAAVFGATSIGSWPAAARSPAATNNSVDEPVDPAVDTPTNTPTPIPTPAAAATPETPGAKPDARPDATPTDADLALIPRTAQRAREASLVAVLAARRQAEADLRTLQHELRSEEGSGREAELQQKIRARADDVAGFARSFSELATGVDPQSLNVEPEPAPFELSRELRTLLSPLIHELKRATSRPRELDRLRTEIADLRDQRSTVDKAIEQLDAIAKTTKDAELVAALDGERGDWQRRRAALETSLEITREKLARKSADTRSVSDTVRDVFQMFFKSRGRNLLLALVATAGFLFVLRRGRTLLDRSPRFTAYEQSFGGRVLSLAYSVITVIGAIVVFVLALYFVGDWVLLILALLLILGLVWASKQALPRFWTQAVLILDMGAVREGQRVWLNGLPWRVESIGFYCVLVNPALVGGRLRIPIEDVAQLRSRADHESEPFFPTRTDDVVLFEGTRPVRVEFQSTEIVRLASPGGNRIVIPAVQFMSQSIEILSQGYRVDVQFGLDYRSQAEITTTTRAMMEAEIERRWRESEWAASLRSVAVEFSTAGPSSLDYFVRVDLDGSQAIDWSAQRRHLASLCVDVCNENGWVIPFPQLTIHAAPLPDLPPRSHD